jgi:hypothetical protein
LADLITLGDVEVAQQAVAGPSVLLRLDPRMLVHLAISRGNAEMAVAGADRADVDRVTASLVASLREEDRDSDDDVPVTFWAQGPVSPLTPRRRIAARPWLEIAENYAASTRTALDPLMVAREPGPGGLILWHGEPGTGKSHALRTLIREWRGWCEAHFITDPETLLGGRTSYLLSALLRSDRDRARLIVLEDAGELLAADARAVAGQALSRLLNVSDGLLGAGLRAIVLVTTNEPVRRMHPAVVRPGRCWAQVEFRRLAAAESNAWLRMHHSDVEVSRDSTLAELFALADGRSVVADQPVGFSA